MKIEGQEHVLDNVDVDDEVVVLWIFVHLLSCSNTQPYGLVVTREIDGQNTLCHGTYSPLHDQ